jgi:tetratricopeptide (TPR) repeat protein
MKTPFRLRKIPAASSAPASALLLWGADAGELLRLCARVGGAALPAVHAVAGGFLVRLGRPDDRVFPGVLRLRALSAGLFVPTDAELTPALLEDEARALVRQRGLVVLPGGRVLAFSPAAVLSAADLVAAPRRLASPWQTLPPRPERAERLHEIILDVPDPPPDLIIEKGGTGIGEEKPRPPAAGTGKTLAGGAAAGLGQGMLWLGDKLGLERLAGMGANLVGWALRAVPRISESVLGRQEAALRELLRQFREGKIEEALRRALPLGAKGGRGPTTPAQDANLPTHSLLYRLGELLGSGGGGSVWLAADDVYRDLEAAYRKAAEEATRRGDYRRAAFIYGKLLQDWHHAAGVLGRGGLHHDAAILYLEKLGDALAAARSFEAAGEVDRALFLYRQRGEHALAGDLLMRAGEPEQAVEEYLLAADGEARRGRWLAAGELLLTRAQRSDLAGRYFEEGWSGRPGADACGCLLRLLDLRAECIEPEGLLRLVDEADLFFAGPGNEQPASDFYNHLVVLGAKKHLAPRRDDLRDRALLGLTRKLRQGAAEGDRGALVSRLFAGSGAWEPAFLRDADVAVRGLPRPTPPQGKQARPAGRPREVARLKTHDGELTAACAAQESGDLFLGFAGGTLAHFDPRRGTVTTWQRGPGDVTGLAVDAEGQSLVMVRRLGPEAALLTSFRAQGGDYVQVGRGSLDAPVVPLLTPIARSEGARLLGVWTARELELRGFPDLVIHGRVEAAGTRDLALVLDGWRVPALPESVLFITDNELHFQVGGKQVKLSLPVFNPAALHEGGAPLVSWLLPQRWLLETAFIDTEGGLHWLSLRLRPDDPAVAAHHVSAGLGYRCASLLQPGQVAAAHRGGVAWLSCGQLGFVQRAHSSAVDLPDAVACFASPLTGELLVVGREGDVIRVPVPG